MTQCEPLKEEAEARRKWRGDEPNPDDKPGGGRADDAGEGETFAPAKPATMLPPD